jgi:hypothetical protein
MSAAAGPIVDFIQLSRLVTRRPSILGKRCSHPLYWTLLGADDSLPLLSVGKRSAYVHQDRASSLVES